MIYQNPYLYFYIFVSEYFNEYKVHCDSKDYTNDTNLVRRDLYYANATLFDFKR